jgi:hypothetical protein
MNHACIGSRARERTGSLTLSADAGHCGDEPMTDEPKPTITAEEMERRRGHVRTAIADSRIEGMATPEPPEIEILEAYIRGEIEAGDLVTAYLSRKPRRGSGLAVTTAPAYFYRW